MRRQARGFHLLLLAASASPSLVSCTRPPQGPNLLLVTVDTLRADELGAYGSPYGFTPVLDRLARSSRLHESAHAPAPWTLPSMATLMTGLEPVAHGAIHFRKPLPAVPTLAERLRARGYHTAAAVTHFLLGPAYGFQRGFDRFEERLIPSDDAEAHLSVTSEELSEIGREMLASTREPFFVWLHYFDPHFHYMPHPPETSTDSGGRRLYRGEVRHTDRALGAVLKAAEDLPRPPVTVLTADHGEQFFEHGGQQHTTAVYQEVILVPLLLADPGNSGGRIVPGPMRLGRLHDEILALAGEDRPEGRAERGILLHSEQACHLRALVTGRFKLIQDRLRDRVELYDLLRDPGEQRDIASESREQVQRLVGELERRFGELERLGERLRGGSTVEISEEREAQLRELGYVE